jgi:hypothetical protein
VNARTAILVVVVLALAPGCSSTTARWHEGATFLTSEERPPRRAEDVPVYFKQSFGVFETTAERLPQACHSTTLLRHMSLVPGAPAAQPPEGDVVPVAELTTQEYPRDEIRSTLDDSFTTRVLGIGPDEFDQFQVEPHADSVALGVRRLREMAAALGADEVRDVFCTGYAEHQMWEGTTFSLTPTSTRSIVYAHVHLLEFRLRDVRLHGTAVRRKEPRA